MRIKNTAQLVIGAGVTIAGAIGGGSAIAALAFDVRAEEKMIASAIISLITIYFGATICHSAVRVGD